MNALKFVILALLASLFSACTSLGLPVAKTFNERLAVGYSSVTAIRLATKDVLVAGKLSVNDAVNIQKQADNIREGLDIAKTLSGSDITAAENRLVVTLQILTALQAYVNAASVSTTSAK